MTNTELALIVPTDPSLAYIHTFNVGDHYSWLADSVEGMITCVTLKDGLEMWVNDEYLYNGSDFNPFATAEYWMTYGAFSHYVNGVAIFTCSDEEGNTTGLTWPLFSKLANLLLDEWGIDLDMAPILTN